jgi:hypothetical protein
MINKRRPTAVVVNSRKKLVMGILERTGEEDLSLPETTPDGSMFRTLLLNTGLYCRQNGGWGFVKGNSRKISDPGLSTVWRSISRFMQTGKAEPKPLVELTSQLLAPPIALREGVLPIYLAAGIRAFGGMTAIRREGILIEDLLPSTVEEMSSSPELYSFQPIGLDEIQSQVLNAFLLAFERQASRGGSISEIRHASELLEEWRETLPSAAQTREFTDVKLNELRELMFSTRDTVILLTERLPEWWQKSGISTENLVEVLNGYRGQLESADSLYLERIETTLRRSLEIGADEDLAIVAREHAMMFPSEFLDRLADEQAAQFVKRLKLPYASGDKLCRSIAQLFTEKRISEFDDRVMADFTRKLHRAIGEIDRTAVWVESSLFGSELKSWLVSNRKRRIQELYTDLVTLAGDSAAQEHVLSFLKREKELAR